MCNLDQIQFFDHHLHDDKYEECFYILLRVVDTEYKCQFLISFPTQTSNMELLLAESHVEADVSFFFSLLNITVNFSS